jgi:hypothetical protein
MTTTQGFSAVQFFAAAVVTSAVVGAFAGVASADSDKKNGISAGTGVEINIGANGNALVRGAEVTAVSGTQVNAETSLGSSVLNWIVKTDSDTDFSAHKGGADGLANIAVGDIISFRGTIDQSVAGLTVRAKQVKDWTTIETKARLEGVVSAINSSLSSFIVKTKSGTTTVQTSSSTKFTEDGDSASFADIALDAKVKVQGLFNASSSVFTAASVDIKDGNDGRYRSWFKHWFKAWYDRDRDDD